MNYSSQGVHVLSKCKYPDMKGWFIWDGTHIESSLVFFSLLFLTPQNMFRVSSLAAKSIAAEVRRDHFYKDQTAEQN